MHQLFTFCSNYKLNIDYQLKDYLTAIWAHKQIARILWTCLARQLLLRWSQALKAAFNSKHGFYPTFKCVYSFVTFLISLNNGLDNRL